MAHRPVNPPKVTASDLIPGDILLSVGVGVLDALITCIDEGDYSHTTQYIGFDGKNHMVVEATEGGIKHDKLSVDMGAQDLIDVYRYVSPDGHHFEDPEWPVKPVLDEAMSYVNANYAYSELLLGAVVVMAAQVPAGGWSPEIRMALSELEHKFVEWLNENQDKTPMTCVQVATSAHWQAVSTPVNKYALQVTLKSPRKSPISPSEELKEYQQIRSSLIAAVDAVRPGFSDKYTQINASVTVSAGSGDLPLGSCTPTDMQTSPTLEFIGCLKDKRI
jgi:hypothetical protein